MTISSMNQIAEVGEQQQPGVVAFRGDATSTEPKSALEFVLESDDQKQATLRELRGKAMRAADCTSWQIIDEPSRTLIGNRRGVCSSSEGSPPNSVLEAP
jgi:hypothetical protein